MIREFSEHTDRPVEPDISFGELPVTTDSVEFSFEAAEPPNDPLDASGLLCMQPLGSTEANPMMAPGPSLKEPLYVYPGQGKFVPGLYEVRDRPRFAEVRRLTMEETDVTSLFDTAERPAATNMARFIMDGLTEWDILELGREAGYDRPIMELTSRDLETCLPYVAKASDAVAGECDDKTLAVYAARDGDLFYDDFVITHPDKRAVLLPASIDLLTSDSMSDRDLAQRFYAAHELGEAWINDNQQRMLGVDTGYQGGAVRYTVFSLADAYGVDVRELLDRSSTRLVCSLNPDVPEIMGLEDAPETIAAGLPKLQRALGRYSSAEKATFPPTWRLASAFQMMPRFHGHFNRLVEKSDGTVIADTDTESVRYDVDTIVPISHSANNTSPVNPVAASIVQFRVVRQALGRIGKNVF